MSDDRPQDAVIRHTLHHLDLRQGQRLQVVAVHEWDDLTGRRRAYLLEAEGGRRVGLWPHEVELVPARSLQMRLSI